MKKISLLLLATAALMASCGGQKSTNKESNTQPSQPKKVFAELLDYRIVAEYPHSTKSYTQGLQYVDGVMWEGTGQEGHSYLQRIDLTTGKIDIVAKLPNTEFGEGITHYKDRIYQLTWTSGIRFTRVRQNFALSSISLRVIFANISSGNITLPNTVNESNNAEP